MRKIHFLILITLLVGVFSACRDQKVTGNVVSSSQEEKEDKDAPYVEGNKNIMRRENEEMQLFIQRYGWQMQRTPTGLYVEILEPGNVPMFVEGDQVALRYLASKFTAPTARA